MKQRRKVLNVSHMQEAPYKEKRRPLTDRRKSYGMLKDAECHPDFLKEYLFLSYGFNL